jgi:hypothetical protein
MRLFSHIFKKITCHFSLDVLFLVLNIWMMSNVGQLQAHSSQEMSMSTTLPSKNPLSYVGVKAENPPNVIRETRAPLTSDTNGPNGPFDLGTSGS